MGIIPPARVVTDDLTKATLHKGSPNLLQMASSGVGRQVASELMDTQSTSGTSGTKDNQPSTSQPRVPTQHSSGLGDAAGGSG